MLERKQPFQHNSLLGPGGRAKKALQKEQESRGQGTARPEKTAREEERGTDRLCANHLRVQKGACVCPVLSVT